jgi:hypothetical protein
MHLNVQSLVPKIDLLNVALQNFDILCFKETWLNTNVANQDISLPVSTAKSIECSIKSKV